MSEPQEQVREDEQEIGDDEMESVSGGVIDGGCIPPFDPPPTFPDYN